MPVDVSRFEFNHHVAMNCICLLVFFFLFVSSVFFFVMDEKKLLMLNALNVACWIVILKYNLRHRKICFFLMCFSIIGSNILYLFTFGWESGFQNYLASMSIFILFHGIIERKYLYIFSLLSLGFYLFYYYADIRVAKYTGQSSMQILFFVNSLFAYLVLFLSISMLRADVNGLLTNLSRTTITDPLTKIYNRHYMLAKLKRIKETSKRYEHEHALLLIDIDHFKKINDGFGHIAGDQVLKDVSKLISNRLRNSDRICRWGGEEFLILMSFTLLSDAQHVAEELRQLVSEHMTKIDAHEIKVTFTGGLVVLNAEESMNVTLNRADLLLYKGKEQGRNVIVTQENV